MLLPSLGSIPGPGWLFPGFLRSSCVWQLLLAHFGGLIWPTLGRCRLGEAFALPPRKNKDRRRSCGNVGIPPLWRDFQGRWKEWETVLGFSTLSTARHFHS